MIDTTAIRKNLKLLIDNDPWIVVDFQFVKPGKGQAFTRTKMKNLISGNTMERTYKSGEKLEEARIDENEMVFLYQSGQKLHLHGQYHLRAGRAHGRSCG